MEGSVAPEAHASADTSEFMDVDDGNPFVAVEAPSNEGAGPS